ncbi:xanthine dehydrogenase subunit D [Radiobacillus sp. PE A8.2]|uniref:xanthine dehydrogenase subunit D n=1 Tax=Radiobacillus sp. PE A8.2 TaxID=3380349 RepID=UPI00388EF6D7
MDSKLNNYKKRARVRPDGEVKVTGKLKYLTDLSFPQMLCGKILRSSYPHAKIISINTEEALKLSGVKAVVTYRDVPGINGFGLIMPDQPVFCEDKVRYVGDAIAAVAADSLEVAEQALQLIRVEYEALPIVDDPVKALELEAPLLYPDGNVLHRAGYEIGDVNDGFSTCAAVVEETYHVPRQMHAYMETEGGVIVPEANGGITVYVGTQHGYKDRFQLARILAIPEESIRIVSSPIGGSFGGKDELNIQPYGALLALATGVPVKIHNTRKESVIAGIKRHPMQIKMKTGVNAQGKLVAHKVEIVADTGAYSTLGPAILDFAVEHATGPYMIPHVTIDGVSVFTNNGVSGEFRGFGGNQITFALESQIDRLAEKLAIDPVELRRRNIRHATDLGPMGHRIAETDGASYVLEAIARSANENITDGNPDKWKKRGSGIAITMHGGGLGYGRLDPAGGRLSFTKDGKIEIAFGFEEIGQGILAVIQAIVTEEFGCGAKDLSIVIGDTALVPHTGSTTASRGTSMVWLAVQKMKHNFQQQMLGLAAQATGKPAENLVMGEGGIWQQASPELVITYQALAEEGMQEPIVVSTSFDFPTTPDTVDGGHFLYAFAGILAQVEVDLLTGKVKVIGLDQVVSAGPVVNELGYKGQIEGGGVMALGFTLMEDAIMKDGRYLTENLDSYLIPNITDVPINLDVQAIEQLAEGDVYGPRGVGEIGSVGVAPAIVKAIHDATGHWVNQLPVTSEEILQAVSRRGEKQWSKVNQ